MLQRIRRCECQVYLSALTGDGSMASQLLSPCISVLLEGLHGEAQDEVRLTNAADECDKLT